MNDDIHQLQDQFTYYEDNNSTDTNSTSNQTNSNSTSNQTDSNSTNNQTDSINKNYEHHSNNLNLYQLTVGQHLRNMKNTIFDVWNDSMHEGFNRIFFTKKNRLFYIGLFLLIIFILYLMLLNLTN